MHGIFFAILILGCAALGCSGANSQLTRCQTDKDQLLATIREQRDNNRVLHEQVASLETRLDQSEKELARQGKPGTQLSSRPLPQMPLPWRSPASSAPANAPGKSLKPPTKSSSTSDLRGRAKLAGHNQQLETDPVTGLDRHDVAVPFDGSTARLTPEGRYRLDDFVLWLKSREASGRQVVVTGTPDRARAVVDYLDSHGIAGERLAVSDEGQKTAGQVRGSGVEIYTHPAEPPE